MKKHLLILLSLAVFSSCEKNVIGDFDEIEQNFSTEEILDKKGAAFSNRTEAWSFKTSNLGAYWMYSWGNTLREEIPENVEYVPMFWGKNSVSDENIARIKGLIEEGKVKYVLGFNEPDGAAQANMTVDEAIALWPKIEQLGVPIGSPATVNPSNAWMVDFMKKAEEQGLRIDFVAVHHYGGANSLAFINKLKQTYADYKKPLWITEFAVADWNATSVENNRYSEAEVIQFMKETLKALDDIDWVQRYSWFDGGDRPPLASSALFDANNNLTALGQVYFENNPNSQIGPGMEVIFEPEVDDSELVINGNFETGEITPWQGFKNRIYTTSTNSGSFAGEIENGDGSLFMVVPVEAGKTYTLKFATKWSTSGENVLRPVIRDEDVAGAAGLLMRYDPVSNTDQWVETTYEYVIPSGVSNIRLVFFKGAGNPPMQIDDVSLKIKE